MAEAAQPVARPQVGAQESLESKQALDPGYQVICWNDPVNLMVYVTHVFMVVFGWPKAKAQQHMLEVHERGRSVLARANLERAEFYVHQLQKYGLHATLERDAT